MLVFFVVFNLAMNVRKLERKSDKIETCKMKMYKNVLRRAILATSIDARNIFKKQSRSARKQRQFGKYTNRLFHDDSTSVSSTDRFMYTPTTPTRHRA